MRDIAKKYQKFKTDAERDKAFSQAFAKTDLDTQRGLRYLFSAGVLDNLDKLNAEIEGASGTIARDLPDAINNSVDQVGRLKAALSQAAGPFPPGRQGGRRACLHRGPAGWACRAQAAAARLCGQQTDEPYP